MKTTPYDPNLRKAADEFKAICQKYDCMGVVLFVSRTHSEHVVEISPSWSIMHIEGEGIRFRSKREDFDTKEQQHEHTEATVHGLTSIVEWTRMLHVNIRTILEQLMPHMKIAWKVWDKPDSVPGDGK